MTKLTGIELKCARLVPSAMFASPGDVVHAAGLSTTQKIAILRRWEFDARGFSTKLEAHAGDREIRILEEVHGALASLGATASPSAATRPARH